MSRVTVHRVEVEFGDCDPAGIVFFPNFLGWMDAASHHFFRSAGLPPWRLLTEIPDSVGAPMLELHTRFIKSASYGDALEVHSSVLEWRRKTFVHQHRVMRGDELLCEGQATRALCVKPPGEAMRAIVIPDWLRERCA